MTTIESNLLDFISEKGEWDGDFEYVDCTKALSPSGLPGIDYALNPYSGCEHGCIYCYGPGVTHSDLSRWRVVRVKRNIPERLYREVQSVEGTIGLGTVTDPYQPAEARFRLSMMCLEVLRDKGMPVHIHTKSDLVLRDIGILKDMDAVVGITITTLDDRSSLMMEPGAPVPQKRFEALRKLVDEGIRAYALIAPTTNLIQGREEEMLRRIAETGAKMVFHDPLNLRNVDDSILKRRGICASPQSRRLFDSMDGMFGLTVSGKF